MAILGRVGQAYDTNSLVVHVHTVARLCMYNVGTYASAIIYCCPELVLIV